MRPLPALVAAAVTVLGLGACDVDVSQDDDRAPVPAEVRAGLATLYAAGDTSPAVVAEAGCFADALTGRLTPAELVEAGIVGDDGRVVDAVPTLTVDVAGAWVDALDSCTPYVEVAARTLAARFDGRLDEASYAVCLGSTVAPDRVRAALVATLTGRYGTDPAVAELEAASGDCARSAISLG
ncbi:hypothetical protein [Nocardioides rubriscoriae]|uniref:hypothetical protein n=1 Tax=Nocardioides rubriscoriae TaxID=642762 RepID=UPI0011E03DBB|nr:hypothetical protein [Nocardioides rubriscoriae]